MAKPKIKHTITKKEWDKKHKDFKLMGKDGIPYIMAYDSKIGTHLVPVKIIEATDAEEKEFHTKLDTLVHNTFGKSPEEMEESVGAELDLIKQSSKDVKDFLKNVFKDSDFRAMKSDKDFIKYLKSIYEGVLVNEEESFTATSKKSGETAVFKSKDTRDAAVKAGTHSKIEDKEDDSKPNGKSVFSKDSGYDAPDLKKPTSKGEPKKDEPKNDGPKVDLDLSYDYASDIGREIEKLEGKISDEDYKKIQTKLEDLKYAQQDFEEAESYDSPEEAEEDGLRIYTQNDLDKISGDLKDMIRQSNGTPKVEPKAEPKKEKPKSEPKKDEPKRVPLDKNDSYYIKTAVEKEMGPAAFKALSYGDMQQAYSDEMEKRGWEQDDRGNWTKPVNESVVNEAKEPEVITTLRKIVKDKQNDLIKDTKSKKKVRVDMNSANLMVQVYDKLRKQSNKDKFVKSGIVAMGHMAYKLMRNESVNEGKFDGIGDLVKSLHFEINPKTAEEKKIELGKRQGEVSKPKQKESGEYSLRLFRKKIKYGNGKDVGVFLPGSYDAVTSKLGDGPHKKAVKKVRWTQKKYDQWLEDMASNGGAKNAFDMAQNAKNEPGLIDWVKKNFRGDKPLQRIQWDIEGFNESVNEGKKRYYQKDGIGKSKYTISYHDGKKKHKDGSDFFDIQIFRNKKDLAKFVNSLQKGGYVYGFGESVNEAKDVEVYHKSYTHAIEAAQNYAGKKGYEIEDDELFTKVGMNSKRPSVGKTTRVSLELLKNGKPQRKMLHIQVYGMKNGYELNTYIN